MTLESEEERIYSQVAASILDSATFRREITPLKKVNDYYPKYIIPMDDVPMGEGGIKQLNIIDFLFGEK